MFPGNHLEILNFLSLSLKKSINFHRVKNRRLKKKKKKFSRYEREARQYRKRKGKINSIQKNSFQEEEQFPRDDRSFGRKIKFLVLPAPNRGMPNFFQVSRTIERGGGGGSEKTKKRSATIRVKEETKEFETRKNSPSPPSSSPAREKKARRIPRRRSGWARV